FTVNVTSADVHKGPSTVTPIIGHVSRGTVLAISRNLGSWLKVPWPQGQDGVGYVHVSMGRITAPIAATPSGAAAPRAASAPGPVTSIPPMTQTSVGERLAPRGLLHVTPASHVIGVGGLVASTGSFGATARAWHDTHLGAQFGFTRDSMTGDAALGRVTSVQI